MLGFSPLCMSPSAYLWSPSLVTLPSSTFARRFIPSAPITRGRSATGLKSTVAATPLASMASSFDFIVALPVHRDGHNGAIVDQSIEHAVGRTYVDADQRTGNAGDLDGPGHLLLRGIDHGNRIA